MADDLKALEGKVKGLEAKIVEQRNTTVDWMNKAGKQTGEALTKAKAYIDKKHNEQQKALGELQKSADAHDKHVQQAAKNVQTLVTKFSEIDKKLADHDAKVKANSDNSEGNRQALVRARKYVDGHDSTMTKKIDELKKVMDAMEKRHTTLIDTQIKNYDKMIRKFIAQEVSKVAKSRR